MTTRRARRQTLRPTLLAAALFGASPWGSWAADTDIYGPQAAGGSSNVVFLLDNTSNWSANNQAWSKNSVTAKCNQLPVGSQRDVCNEYVVKIFGAETGLEQGRVQLRALKLVLNELVCTNTADALQVNVGLALMGSQSVESNGHGVGLINFAVQALTGSASVTGSSCQRIVEALDNIDLKIQNPEFKAPSSANYGAAMYEVFKYFGGHTHPGKAGDPEPNGAAPVSDRAFGPARYSVVNVLDDPAAFTSSSRTTYKSPIDLSNSCDGNYLVLVGNTYPNAEPNNGQPTRFQNLGYTPPLLPLLTSDTGRFADEWAYFLANTDVSNQPGLQRVFSYTINTYNDKPDPAQGKLLRSMAAVGGIGPGGYLEVGGDLYALVEGFRAVLSQIAARNSVFTATTLPVSTTTQGTFLNQIFVGMFRPDAGRAPRWVGNLKQYQLGLVGGELTLVDRNNQSAVSAGVFSATALSFWTKDSVYFAGKPMGSPATASDSPDGAIVDKGGAAQRLREANLTGASGRKLYTLPASPTGGAELSAHPFKDTNAAVTTEFPAAAFPGIIDWVRGENNVPTTDTAGAEELVGHRLVGTVSTALGTTGARHSIHGDVLHSRPVALNYGSQGVVVYYGANDGIFRAVDGNKTGSGGEELWGFVAPEHYDLLKRLRAGTPKIHLPETGSAGQTLPVVGDLAPKAYGMDGPIGVYALYSNADTLSKAYIYPTMRRGGRSVYALDVTSRTDPKFKWKITGGVTAGFEKLAQTWSMPKAVVTKPRATDPAQPAPILIMGGGYDPAEDQNSSSNIGNAIYILNGETGAVIKEFSTAFSVPSDATVVDVNGDGEPDRAYVADIRGGLYRIDFPTTGSLLASDTWASTSAVKIADVGTGGRKVFFAPDAIVTKNFVAVLLGTGDREKPLLVETPANPANPLPQETDRFALIKDTVEANAPVTTALTLSDLTQVGRVRSDMTVEVLNAGVNDPQGCYLSLSPSEKVVNAPFSIAGATYFGTNRPKPQNAASCSADLGQAFTYQFPLFCGVPKAPTAIEGGGLPPSPVGGIVTIEVDGKQIQKPFIIGGSGPSPFDVDEPKPPIPPIRTRQTWRIDNSNR